MPTTPVYGWPFQQLSDPPDGASLGEDLALAIERTVQALSISLNTTISDLAALTTRVTTNETNIAAIQAQLALNQVGQLITSTSETSNSAGFTTVETVITTVTFTAEANCSYIIEGVGKLGSGGSDIYQCRFRLTNVAGTELDAVRHASQTSDQARGNGLSLRVLYTQGGAGGSVTVVMTGLRISGAGTVIRIAGATFPMLTEVTLVDRP